MIKIHLPKGVFPTYGIVTSNRDMAKYYIDSIKDTEKSLGNNVEKYINSSTNLQCYMKNGLRIIWVQPNSSARGYRFAKVYIDLFTCTFDVIQNEILPICIFADSEDIYTFQSEKWEEISLFNFIKQLKKVALIHGDIPVFREDSEFSAQRITEIEANKREISIW